MTNTSVKPSVQCEQIRFVPTASAGAAAVMHFTDPEPLSAVCVSLPLDALDAAPGDADLTVLLIPREAADAREWQRRGHAWLETQAGPHDAAAVRVPLSGDHWIVYRPGRVVIIAAARELDVLRTAVIEFAGYDRALRQLETQIAADWPLVEKHVPLVHDVTAKDLENSRDIGPITVQAMRRRMIYARLEPHLLRGSDAFGLLGKQAARRLRARTHIEARLEAVDAQIEVAEDIYDMANQRRGEYINFLRGYKIEVAILIVLALELLFILVDFYLSHIRHVAE